MLRIQTENSKLKTERCGMLRISFINMRRRHQTFQFSVKTTHKKLLAHVTINVCDNETSLPLSALRLRREQNKFYLLCRAAATKRSVATKASLCQREVWRGCKYKWFTTTILRVKKKSPPKREGFTYMISLGYPITSSYNP